MTDIKPSMAQYSVDEHDGVLSIEFKRHPRPLALFSLFFTFATSIVIFLSVIFQVLDSSYIGSEEAQGLGMMLVVMAIFCVSFYRSYCRMLGRETVRLDRQRLQISKTCFKRQVRKSFDIKFIRNLRAGTKGKAMEGKIPGMPGSGNGIVEFDYGADTFSFGDRLTGPEVRDLIFRINAFNEIPDTDRMDEVALATGDEIGKGMGIESNKTDGEVSLKNLLRHK